MQAASESAAHATDAMAYPTIPPSPGSPTLTNPDMILPDYDDTASSPDRMHSPLEMWKNAQANNIQFDQFDLSPNAFTGPITPTTPIIYGNGTMLSDIGEVTEVESVIVPGKSRSMPPRGAAKRLDAGEEPTRRRVRNVSRERRASIDSTSTITSLERPQVFADFDDTVSVDDSNFQGDDEDSVADSYIDDESVQEGPSPIVERSQRHGDSTALSRRAEQILANAKQRLTTMENNLSRARNIQSPLSSYGSESTPSPTFARPPTAVHRENDVGRPSKPYFGHARVSSENSLSTGFKSNTYTQRSSSALGAAGGYRPPALNWKDSSRASDSPRESPKEHSIYGHSSYTKSQVQISPQLREPALEPLSEDGDSSPATPTRQSLENERLDTFLSPTFGSYNELGLKRSASTAQMRDLKEQMNELKGRLSSLRDQARADTMKRRSLQSLRTPSPFTHARVDQWYAGPKKANAVADIGTVNESPDEQPANETVPSASDLPVASGDKPLNLIPEQNGIDESSSESRYTEVDEEAPQTELRPATSQIQHSLDSPASPGPSVREVVDDDMKTEDGYQDEGQNDYYDTASESGESSYHDTVQNQVSHEDREDAFDYEHFFLHSAMGSMSRRRNRSGSESSYTSDDSTETTRGPTVPGTERARRGSTTSVSSADTFATATEGRNTRAEYESTRDRRTKGEERPARVWSQTPDKAKHSEFEGANLTGMPRSQSSAATFPARPSHSSLSSVSTHRSFPLVTRPKSNGGLMTPRDSPDQGLKRISESLLSDAASVCDKDSIYSADKSATTIDVLQRDDQILVERLVASLGRCILGLTESGRATPENRMYRRRIESAKRILEGLDETA